MRSVLIAALLTLTGFASTAWAHHCDGRPQNGTFAFPCDHSPKWASQIRINQYRDLANTVYIWDPIFKYVSDWNEQGLRNYPSQNEKYAFLIPKKDQPLGQTVYLPARSRGEYCYNWHMYFPYRTEDLANHAHYWRHDGGTLEPMLKALPAWYVRWHDLSECGPDPKWTKPQTGFESKFQVHVIIYPLQTWAAVTCHVDMEQKRASYLAYLKRMIELFPNDNPACKGTVQECQPFPGEGVEDRAKRVLLEFEKYEPPKGSYLPTC